MTDRGLARGLFRGVVAEDLLHPYPDLTRERRDTLARLVDEVRGTLEKTVDAARIDRERAIPDEALAALRHLGLFGMAIPEEYGGLGLSARAHARLTQEVAGHDASVALTIGAHQSLGAHAIVLRGTEPQRRRWLPRLRHEFRRRVKLSPGLHRHLPRLRLDRP